ncbi:MAG: nucleotide sugar dehydrogenase [Chloroflexota bacterium]
MSYKQELLDKFQQKTAQVCVIGMGYVGLPLAVEFARAGLSVVGLDINEKKCRQINDGQSYIRDIPSEMVADLVDEGLLRATADYSVLDTVDAAVICVPTPLGKSKDPDISYIVAAADELAGHMHEGMLVVLESTTYPGTTKEILMPRLVGNGYTVGEDVFLAFSPERVDPGNARYATRNIPKLVGGMTPACFEVASALYSTAVDEIVSVSSPATAEMAKILENTFRAVNIGLVNEMAQICHRMGIDIWEVVDAAATKPFGFMPFYPGPGLGGHCIPVDPLYLTWKMRGLGVRTRFIELADTVNAAMPHYVVSRVQDLLNEEGKPLRGARILVLGVAYKADVDDLRESPALLIMQELQERGAQVAYNDPYIEELQVTPAEKMISTALSAELLSWADCVLVHTAHSAYDWEWVGKHARLVFDTRNALDDSVDCRVARL